jgi:4a-hydroxytetrahydrobiopterin dehydratase
VERRLDAIGLVQLRAGRCLIDLLAADSAPARRDTSSGEDAAHNLHHFCLRLEPFVEEKVRQRLASHGVVCGDLAINYGAEGRGPALYFTDPEGNRVELKGPPLPAETRARGLAAERCEACRSDAPRLSESEIAELCAEVPAWKVVEREGIQRLERSFRFPDFAAALEFTNRVAEAAELAGHHPDLLTTWGAVTVTWWTHKIKGLHRSDFIMAARTDVLAP